MKTIAKVGLAVVLAIGLATLASAADETTVTGNVMCAKCALKKTDATKCQVVLVVEDGGKSTEYYIEQKPMAKKFGHACKSMKAAVVTGAVTEKDGKKWIAPSKMDEKKS